MNEGSSLISEGILREAEDRLILLERKAEVLEHDASPFWTELLLFVSNALMGVTLIMLILQARL